MTERTEDDYPVWLYTTVCFSPLGKYIVIDYLVLIVFVYKC